MQQGRFAVAIVRGEGLVARFGDVVMYVADVSSSAEPLFAAAESVAGLESPGAAIAGQLATIAFQPTSAQAFGVVAPTDDGLLVLLRGNVTAEIDAGETTQELSGARSLTWVDEIVPTTTEIAAVRVGSSTGLTGSPQTDLRGGVVLGGGFVLGQMSTSHEPPPEPQSVAQHTMVGMEPTQAPTAAGTASPAETAASQAVSPAETAASQAVSPAETAASQTVSPSSVAAGTSTFASVDAVLVAEDGATFPLDRAYVIGRDPLLADEVRNAQASPIVVRQDRHISRVHAYITVEGDAVFVRDNATPGGTFIAAPGTQTWTEIGATPTKLEPGWSMLVGEQVLTYRAGS